MKRFCHTIVVALVFIFAPPLKAQATWPTIYNADGVSVALDLAGAEKNADGSYITRTRWDYATARKLESKRPYTQMTETALLKCTPVRVKRLTESFYAEGGAVVREGSMPSPGEVQYMTWDRPRAKTEGARAFANICAELAKKAKARR